MLIRLFFAVLVVSGSAQALAQDRVSGVAGGRTSIKSYTDADGKTFEGDLKVAGLKFPLRVLERSPTHFLRVKIEYEDPSVEPRTAWLDSAQVKLNASHEASCIHRDKSASAIATAATRGANGNCK